VLYRLPCPALPKPVIEGQVIPVLRADHPNNHRVRASTSSQPWASDPRPASKTSAARIPLPHHQLQLVCWPTTHGTPGGNLPISIAHPTSATVRPLHHLGRGQFLGACATVEPNLLSGAPCNSIDGESRLGDGYTDSFFFMAIGVPIIILAITVTGIALWFRQRPRGVNEGEGVGVRRDSRGVDVPKVDRKHSGHG
jgi:hypothetical protein